MKTIWKWVIGVVIGLVIVAGLGFAVLGMKHSRSVRFVVSKDFNYDKSEGYGYDKPGGYDYDDYDKRSPIDGFDHGFYKYKNHGFNKGGYGGGEYSHHPILILVKLLHKLIPLGVLALAIYLAYQQGKKIGAAEAIVPPKAKEPAKKKAK
ncbi:MAG: hypothetical protein QGM50_05050 [Anaerolineae bacterium]|nr:hypothetical protein [Anaerolineae bacterium]MDK1080801.1 hypothetical protein [Anaerolineae bacterium]MDK1118143.1 hypothetical protein [Anaerolineae bacterium]